MTKQLIEKRLNLFINKSYMSGGITGEDRGQLNLVKL